MVGGDDAAERAPGVRVHSKTATKAFGLLAVHHVEAKRELLPQLFLALAAERRRGEDQDSPDATPEQQLGEDQPRLDGLAETHVVGDEEAHARHAKGFQEWDELVALDAHPAVERARDRLPVERSLAVWVEVGRERRPARRAEKRVEILGRHGAASVRGGRQRVRLQEVAVGLYLPEDAFLGWSVVVLVLEVYEVEAPRLAVERLDGRDHPAPVADGNEHPGPGDGDRIRRWRGCGHGPAPRGGGHRRAMRQLLSGNSFGGASFGDARGMSSVNILRSVCTLGEFTGHEGASRGQELPLLAVRPPAHGLAVDRGWEEGATR